MGTTMAGAIHGWPSEKTGIDATRCSDQELSRRVAAGDMSAFEEVYRRHYRLVYSLCLRMTQNVAEAEDIAQDIFISLYHKLGSFRGESAFTTWLHRLTVNHVLMHFRKVKSRRDELTADGTMPERESDGERGAARLPFIDSLALNRAIAQLSPGYRAVFILHDIEGYEHEEVARMLGCSTGTSKSQLHKARIRLRKLLSNFTPPKRAAS